MVRTATNFALVGMLAWGAWALFADFATRSLAPEVAMAISYVVGVGVAIVYIAVQSIRSRLRLSRLGNHQRLAV